MLLRKRWGGDVEGPVIEACDLFWRERLCFVSTSYSPWTSGTRAGMRTRGLTCLITHLRAVHRMLPAALGCRDR